jgi:DNA-binding NtrC family response regulator
MSSSPPPLSPGGLRVVICDYNALLQSVTGLLRMSGYRVFQAYDGQAAEELCSLLPDVGLLVLNTDGTGMDSPSLIRSVRVRHPGLPVLHIGAGGVPDMPEDVPTLAESFTSEQLLAAVHAVAPR